MAISLTTSAAERIRSHLARRGTGLGLRLGIKPSGCSGFSYVIDYADEARADDLVFDSHGVKVFVVPASLPALAGTCVDFVRQALHQSPQLDHPNGRGECGRGESFSV